MTKAVGSSVSTLLPAPRLIVAVVVVVVIASGYGVSPAEALRNSDTAGTLDGVAISVGEVDSAADVGAARNWGDIYHIVEAAAHGICVDRALERLIAEADIDLSDWKADIWREVEPSPSMVGDFINANPRLFESLDRPDERLIAHRLRVQRYRARILAQADGVIGRDFHLLIGEFSKTEFGEPRLGPIVAHCLDGVITAKQVEEYAAFPLYRRRASLVASICRQFDIDYSNPLLLTRLARAENMTPEELLRSKEANVARPDESEVRKLAADHYGSNDASSIAKARLALDTLNRGQARMAFLEELRRNAVGSCSLSLPAAPVVTSRLGPDSANGRRLRVRYFANFACRHCQQSWQLARRLAEEHAARVTIELHHHFPDSVAPLFEDALAAECSARQGRLWDYANWRFQRYSGEIEPDSLARAIEMDAATFGGCMADPLVAVKVLDDTEEALRLGFREAVPSWVIGRRPRRGFQGEVVLDRTIAEEVKWND